MKTCIKCQQTKPLTDFYKHRKAKDKLASKCKLCDKAYRLVWAAANRDRLVRYRKDNSAKFVEQNKWRYREHHYGLTKEMFLVLLEEQGNLCKICGMEFNKEPHVDHCHSTGKVRGLLCGNRNTALGLTKDSTETLGKMIVYLTEN